ncbi:Bud site selection protein 6 [Rhizina undulata]
MYRGSPQKLSTIEKSVTHLLVATKQLLETLTAWSRGQATEAEVSDVYVRLGSEFNIACRAFTAIGVETSDLGNVPDALRTILESTLSQDASPQSLDEYLPRIREIIINLLHGLKRKQQKIRQRNPKDGGEGSGTASTLGERPATSHHPAPPPRTRSNEQIDDMAPPRSTSLPGGGGLPIGNGLPIQRASSPIPPYPTNMRSSVSTNASRSSHQHTASLASTQSSPPMQSMPIIETPSTPVDEPPRRSVPPYFTPPPPPPPPPPTTQDALAALQRGGELERRASRRYSAYQIAKLTGASTNGVSMLPPSRDPSSLPRNRESKESLDAIRVRQSYRTKSVIKHDASPMRPVSRISEEEHEHLDSPMARTPVDKEGPAVPEKDDESFRNPPTLKVDTGASPPPTPQKETVPETPPSQGQVPPTTISVISPPEIDERRSSTPSAGKDLTLFLQLGRSIKKVVLPDGIDELSISSLRLLFISKFNYNPPSGDDFPEIYLQDPASGVRYELEDLRDVKDRAVLCLNVEVLDEVKRHIDDGMDGLKKLVEGLKGSVEGQGLQIQRVAERQEEAAKKIAELSIPPPAASPVVISPPELSKGSASNAVATKVDTAAQMNEIRDLRKDLAVLRQVYSTFVADINSSMTTIKAKASSVKAVAAVLPTNEGRAQLESGKKVLSTDADNLVTRVEDLQDTVEDLRKDVVQRGVRPLPRQIDTVKKEISRARLELKKMDDYIKREKPVFRRVWERELEVVCEEQEFFNMQENLIEDLQDDLDKATQTFQLVEQCTEQQSKHGGGATGPVVLRNVSRSQAFGQTAEDVDPTEAKDSVLSEVRALRPNHEGRLEAIERAEKARAKELESRVPEFQKELGEFVEENKLKKAGGVEEAERLRKARDERARKEIWERKKKMDGAAEAAEAGAGSNEAVATDGDNTEA